MKTLLIVDIQETMGHWFSWNYIKKVYNFLNKHSEEYDQIFMIMEPEYPTDVRGRIDAFGNVTGGGFSADILKEFKEDEIPAFIYEYLTKEPIYKVYNQAFWKNVDHSLEEVELPPKHEWAKPYSLYLDKEFQQLLAELKKASEVDVIGGGLTKCVELTSRLLETQNIEHEVNSSFCYEIRMVNTNWKSDNTFDTAPTSAIPMKLRDGNKQLRMKKVSLSKDSFLSEKEKPKALTY